ncbi:diguanylate cyclase (GGDEF)-like protein/PAS domain S-box-containing protein [Actinoplanes lutulentus]|uniref:PAS domain S-box-containing protein/diguanylate cyclase (GGDEF)-like protein n=1 Tax=Actinoplanes lutulentus TaxID=1287878 RepID=A0A327ZFU8_9ACTN|nr:diguanylate cyclase [Actinoplanes lutulentus]MBB2942463.1 diguanylate cyclase (GGDEF)-like protein/PAS domain S-box-containing protein [Actinoplanes lutulentus]RAK33233.1 PAS domain S-box-containing protein/diguanylate cyclase (GGDEF)-like protein [Actinoplanes lutulentus]
MRLRNWIAVVVSVLLLAAAGVVGFVVNRSALRAADTVHRADSSALGTNNGTLTGQLQVNSAAELSQILVEHALHLGKDSAADRGILAAAAAKSTTFQYGLLTADMNGDLLTSSRASGLPAAADAGWAPMKAQLAEGQAGFSDIMIVDGMALAAVAVPIPVNNSVIGYLIGLNQVTKTALQSYAARLSAETHTTLVADSSGVVGASSDRTLIGTKITSALQSDLDVEGVQFVEYKSGKTPMIAIVYGGLPSGWTYMRIQTKSSFDGVVHSRSQTLNLTLLAMLLIGVAGISVLGYRTQVTRRRADERFQALFQHAPDLVSVLDGRGRIVFSSPSALAVLGYKTGALAGHSVFDLIHPEDEPEMRQRLSRLLDDPDGVVRMQCRARSADGEYRWFEFTASNQMHNPALSGVVINARDISENRAFQERLTHEAQHDPLTGLPNRRRMQDVLDSSLASTPVAVLFVDLDGFKPVNDVHGHEVGDELLRQVSDRLTACVRETDVLSRVGGDEFVVLMPGVLSEKDAATMSGRIRYVLELPFRIGGQEILIGASIGVHLAPAAENPDAALRAADHAMYAIKHAGGSRRAGVSGGRMGRHRASD